MTFDPLDVVVVPFPFSDRRATKRRPALVISSTAFNRAHAHAILTMITSTTRDRWESDVPLDDWRQAGLATACRVRFKVFTLDKFRVLRRLGRLSARDGEAVVRSFARHLILPEVRKSETPGSQPPHTGKQISSPE